jgi:hypothetical protein
MPHFGINQRFPPPPNFSKKCAECPGITVRHTPESLCGMERILQNEDILNLFYIVIIKYSNKELNMQYY